MENEYVYLIIETIPGSYRYDIRGIFTDETEAKMTQKGLYQEAEVVYNEPRRYYLEKVLLNHVFGAGMFRMIFKHVFDKMEPGVG